MNGQIGQSIPLIIMQNDLYLSSGLQVAFGYCGEIISSLLIAVFRDMPSFRPPVYSKQHDAKKNTVEACYTFSIDFQEEDSGLSFTADNANDITITSIDSLIHDNMDWWKQFVQQFMQASSKMFAKPYTVEQINKITKHAGKEWSYDSSFPVTVEVLPTTIKIQSGVFWVYWDYRFTPNVIDIPVSVEEEVDATAAICLPDLAEQVAELPSEQATVPVDKEVEEVNLDELNIDGNATEDLELSHSARFYDKQRVKEARLKAKLAQYKAELQMRMYYDKYGNDASETDADSDDSYTSSEEEEVQL
jgi:hypothetical protein